MNDLGMTLVWSAIQVTLFLVPAASLHVLASRRSPASGSWIATVGLSLSVVVGVATFIPRDGKDSAPVTASMAGENAPRGAEPSRAGNPNVVVQGSASSISNTSRLMVELSRGFLEILGGSSAGQSYRQLDSGDGGALWPWSELQGSGSACSASSLVYGPSGCVDVEARS